MAKILGYENAKNDLRGHCVFRKTNIRNIQLYHLA